MNSITQTNKLDFDKCWQLVQAKSKDHDGEFFYAVKSTGIYCKPSCFSRRPNVENVSFYDSSTTAQKAGFRACKRCKPA